MRPWLILCVAALFTSACTSSSAVREARPVMTFDQTITRQQNDLAEQGIDVLRITVEGSTVHIIAAWTQPLVLKAVNSSSIRIDLWSDLGMKRIVMESPDGRRWECNRRVDQPDKWRC